MCKIKNKVWLFAVAFIACAFCISSVKADDRWEEGTGEDPPGRQKSMSFSHVDLYINNDGAVEVFFLSNMGTVSLELKNSRGITVFVQSVDTAFDDSVEIGIAGGMPADVYTLDVKDSDGNLVKQFAFAVAK